MNTVRVISPVDGSTVAEYPLTTDAQLEAALTAAARAQAAWARTPLEERQQLVARFVEAMLAMAEEIVPELARCMGRPVAVGGGELRGFEERARTMARLAPEALAPVMPLPRPGFTRYIRREPLGVVLVVAPWNYPYLTAVNAVVPAILAGNAVILKHATQTLPVGERFRLAMERAGAPAGLFHHLVLSHAQVERLLESGRVHHLVFTGSVEGGRRLGTLAARSLLGANLELGGKDPAYVRPDVDLDFAAEQLVDGAFFNSGQSCCAIERIYVHRQVFEPFLERFVDRVRRYVLGNPLDPRTTLGPLVSRQAAEAVRRQIQEAVAMGARPLIDPAEFPADTGDSAYLAPQVLVGVDHRMAIMREETFGPAVGLMPVADDDEALRLMNDSRYGLTAALFTRDLARAQELGERLAAGTIFLNRCDYLDPELAWTGVKDSGRGASLSRIGFEQLTRPRSFHLCHHPE